MRCAEGGDPVSGYIIGTPAATEAVAARMVDAPPHPLAVIELAGHVLGSPTRPGGEAYLVTTEAVTVALELAPDFGVCLPGILRDLADRLELEAGQ